MKESNGVGNLFRRIQVREEKQMWDMPENQLIQTATGDCGLGAGAQVLVGTKKKKRNELS